MRLSLLAFAAIVLGLAAYSRPASVPRSVRHSVSYCSLGTVFVPCSTVDPEVMPL